MKSDKETRLEYALIFALVVMFYTAISYLLSWLGVTFR